MLIKLYIDNKIVLDTTVKQFEIKLEFSDGWIRRVWGLINKKTKPKLGLDTKRIKRNIEAANRTLDKMTLWPHRPTLYECPHCDRSFNNKRSLRTHLGWHVRWKPEYKGGENN